MSNFEKVKEFKTLKEIAMYLYSKDKTDDEIVDEVIETEKEFED